MMSRPSVLCNCCRDSLVTSPLNSLYFDVAICSSCRDPLFFAADVATTRYCRDLCSLFLLSRLLHDVATSSLCNCCRDNQVLS